jgi:CRP-like cAMP-binding protein
MRNSFVSRLVRNRFQSPKDLHRLWEAETAATRRSEQLRPTRYIKGTHKGQFVRIKVPAGRPPPARLTKLLNPANPPIKAFVHPPPPATHHHATHSALSHKTASSSVTASTSCSSTASSQGLGQSLRVDKEEFFREYGERLRLWWKANWAVLVLNLGSVFTLVGFTRSDVLELRTLSVTGSCASLIYFASFPAAQRALTPLLWSLTFISVNGFKIVQILVERQAKVYFQKEQEDAYRLYFQPHGMTPKQFEYVMEKATTLHLQQGDLLVKEGDLLDRVYLVTSGQTRAHHLGRRLTAVSFTPNFQATQQGGPSGAWVGEMAFLERCWNKNDKQQPSSARTAGKNDSTTLHPSGPQYATARAMYTIAAVQDKTIVLVWSHADMEGLLVRSPDMRVALTRAMTAAIVGKVVNFTASRKASNTSWWGSLWPQRSPTPTRVLVEDEEASPEKVKVDQKPVFLVPEEKA